MKTVDQARRRTRHLLFAAALMPAVSYAAPTGGTVVAGQIKFGANGPVTTVTQGSQNAIIHWDSFSIAHGETLRFAQPGANAAVLNRVGGLSPSIINGVMSANGRVFVINPNGVVIGPNGVVTTGGGFVASTRDIANDAFLRGGDLSFEGSSAGKVENLGFIKADNGDVILVGRAVKNTGVVEASRGLAGFAAGDRVLLTPAGKDRLSVAVDASRAKEGTGVDNSGAVKAAQARLQAAGGDVYALAINAGGTIEATGFSRTPDGRVVLAAEGGDIRVSGKIAAHDADGSGGTVLVGGGDRGADASVPNAAKVTVTATAFIEASAATDRTDGGHVTIWSDRDTDFAGNIVARGGAAGGDGGFAEVSGKRTLVYTGLADLRAPAGKTGALLLDPEDIYIDTNAGAVADSTTDTQGNVVRRTITGVTLLAQLKTASVTLDTSGSVSGAAGDIVFYDSGKDGYTGWDLAHANVLEISAPHGITLNATRDIVFNAPVRFSSGASYLAKTEDFSLSDEAGRPVTTIADSNVRLVAKDTAGPALPSRFVRNPDGSWRSTAGYPVTVNSQGFLLEAGELQLESGYAYDSQGAAYRILDAGATLRDAAGNNYIGAYGALYHPDGTAVVLAQNTGDVAFNAGRDITLNAAVTFSAKASGIYASNYSRTEGLGEHYRTAAVTQGDVSFHAAGSFTANAALTFEATSTGSDGGTGARVWVIPLLPDTTPAHYVYSGAGVAGGDVTLGDITVTAKAISLNAPVSIDLKSAGGSGSAAGTSGTADAGGAGGAITTGVITFDATGGILSSTAFMINAPVTASLSSDGGAGGAGLRFANTAAGAGGAGGKIAVGKITFDGSTGNYSGVHLLDNGFIQYDLASTGGATGVSHASLGALSPGGQGGAGGAIDADGVLITGGLIKTAAGTHIGVSANSSGGQGGDVDVFSQSTYDYTAQAGGAGGAVTVGDFAISGKSVQLSGDFLGLNAVSTGGAAGRVDQVTGALWQHGGAGGASGIITFGELSVTSAGTIWLGPQISATRAIGSAGRPNTGGYTYAAAGAAPAPTGGDIRITAGDLIMATSEGGGMGGSLVYGAGNVTLSAGNGVWTPNSWFAAQGTLVFVTDNKNPANPSFNPAAYIDLEGSILQADPSLNLSETTAANRVARSGNIAAYHRPDNVFIFAVAPDPTKVKLPEGFVPVLGPAGTPFAGNLAYGHVGGYTEEDTNLNFYYGDPLLTPGGIFFKNLAPRHLLTVTANAASATYGFASPPAFGATYSGFVNGNTLADFIAPSFDVNASIGANAGTYTITPYGMLYAPAGHNVILSGRPTHDYAFKYVSGVFTVNRADLFVGAANASMVYGDLLPALTAGIIGGLRNGDLAADVVSFAPVTDAVPGSHAGAYDIRTGATLLSGNYILRNSAGTLTVTPATLDVTADSVSKVYGATMPALTGSVLAGLKNGDLPESVVSFAPTTDALQSSNTGTYVIRPGATLLSSDYRLGAIDDGVLTITAAPLVIRADDITRDFRADNPALTWTIGGLVNGDTAAVVNGLALTTDATTASLPGPYAVTQAGFASAANYAITFVPGTLNVGPLGADALKITADDQHAVYGFATLPRFTARYDGLVYGDAPEAVTGLRFATTARIGSNAGSYTITPYGATAPGNYRLEYADGVLTVGRAPLTIAADSYSRALNTANPAFTATFVGLADGDTPASVTGLNFAAGATTASPAGTYTITPRGAMSANYDITYETGSLVVRSPHGLTLAAADATKTYGDANPEFTLKSTAGLLDGDTVTTVGYATQATLGSNVGRYAVTPYGAVIATAVPREYDVTYLPGVLTINPAVLNVVLDAATLHRSAGAWSRLGTDSAREATATSATSSTGYAVDGGGSDNFTYTVSGFRFASDTARLTTNGAPGFARGANGVPEMSRGSLDAGANYTFALTPVDAAKLAYVRAIPLTLTNATAKVYDDSKFLVTSPIFVAPDGSSFSFYANVQYPVIMSGTSYATNWTPGAASGVYWSIPTTTEMRASGAVDSASSQRPSFTLTNPYYLPNPGNPSTEYVVNRVAPADVVVYQPNGTLDTTNIRNGNVSLAAVTAYARSNPNDTLMMGVPVASQDVLLDVVGRMLTDAKTNFGKDDALKQQTVVRWIQQNASNPNAQLLLLPYLMREAIELGSSGKTLTAGQKAFANAITSRVREDRINAAESARAGYYAWKSDTQQAQAEQFQKAGLLSGLFYVNTVDPPPGYLAVAKSGLTGSQITGLGTAIGTIVGTSVGAVAGANSAAVLSSVVPYSIAQGATASAGTLASISAGPAVAVTFVASVVAQVAGNISKEAKYEKALDQAVSNAYSGVSLQSLTANDTLTRLQLMSALQDMMK